MSIIWLFVLPGMPVRDRSSFLAGAAELQKGGINLSEKKFRGDGKSLVHTIRGGMQNLVRNFRGRAI